MHALRQLAEETADRQAEVMTAAGVLAAPERHHRRRPFGRVDQLEPRPTTFVPQFAAFGRRPVG
jgi:hypothetical protein